MPDSGKPWVVIRLGDSLFGVSSSQVQQMISLPEVNSVPQAPDYIRGIINLRGKVIPILDLRAKFQLSSESYGERACIIVVQVGAPPATVTLMVPSELTDMAVASAGITSSGSRV